MSEIRVGENESLESALRRFKRSSKAGVLAEVRKGSTMKAQRQKEEKSEAAKRENIRV